MENKNGIVRSIQGSGTYNGKYGLLFKYELLIDNGDAGEYLSKSSTPEELPFKVGEVIYYQWEGGQYPKIKKPGKEPLDQRESNFKGGSKGGFIKEEPLDKLVSISLGYTKDLLIAGKIEFKDLKKVTKRLANIQLEIKNELAQVKGDNKSTTPVNNPAPVNPPPPVNPPATEYIADGSDDLPF